MGLRFSGMNDEEARKRLLETLNDVDGVNRSLREEAQRFSKLAQSGIDDAAAVRGLLHFGNVPRANVDSLTTVWRSQADAGRSATHILREARLESQPIYFGTTSQASTAAIDVVEMNVSNPEPASRTSGFQAMELAALKPTAPAESLQQAVAYFAALNERGSMLANIIAGMTRCGLDRGTPPHRSAMDLLAESQAALDAPSGSDTVATPAIIQLRQCIERTVYDLYLRGTPQMPGSNWRERVLAIGRRSARDSVPPSHFDALAAVVEDKVKTFAPGKDNEFRRPTIHLLAMDGLRFLRALLEGVDEKKLRSVATG